MAELALDKYDPARKAKRVKAKTEKTSPPPAEVEKTMVKPRSRYIKASARHQVEEKNKGQGCAFVDRKTGHRCGSQKYMQIDHITPFAVGGRNGSENLRILCGMHNRWEWASGSP